VAIATIAINSAVTGFDRSRASADVTMAAATVQSRRLG
jgi:hypothetical protein